MSYIKCGKCKKDFFIDDSNPNVHYNSGSKQLCSHCRNYESLPKGGWYQDEKGEYHQK